MSGGRLTLKQFCFAIILISVIYPVCLVFAFYMVPGPIGLFLLFILTASYVVFLFLTVRGYLR